MDFILHPVEQRVLGALLEKDITTPEYYPLTMNALVAACNQKSNRDPVVSYDEGLVERAIEALREKGFATIVTGGGNRVPKYAQSFSERLNLGRRDLAILCELLVRGPQTPGELRNRGSRMYDFSDLEEVEGILRSLSTREPHPYIVQLPHQPGTKEQRWAHLLGGEPVMPAAAPVTASASAAGNLAPSADRIGKLEGEVASLREEVLELRKIVEDFRRQFE